MKTHMKPQSNPEEWDCESPYHPNKYQSYEAEDSQPCQATLNIDSAL